MFSGISELGCTRSRRALPAQTLMWSPFGVGDRHQKDSPLDAATSPLLTDLYQINMIQSYLDHGDTETADLRGSRFPGEVQPIPERRGIFLMLTRPLFSMASLARSRKSSFFRAGSIATAAVSRSTYDYAQTNASRVGAQPPAR
jgi:hypothetical protein